MHFAIAEKKPQIFSQHRAKQQSEEPWSWPCIVSCGLEGSFEVDWLCVRDFVTEECVARVAIGVSVCVGGIKGAADVSDRSLMLVNDGEEAISLTEGVKFLIYYKLYKDKYSIKKIFYNKN